MVSWARTQGEDVLITVWVVPRASSTGIAGAHGDALKVRVAVPPEAGKANEAVVSLLTGLLGAPILLESGSTQRMKIVRAVGISLDEVARNLA